MVLEMVMCDCMKENKEHSKQLWRRKQRWTPSKVWFSKKENQKWFLLGQLAMAGTLVGGETRKHGMCIVMVQVSRNWQQLTTIAWSNSFSMSMNIKQVTSLKKRHKLSSKIPYKGLAPLK